ncbi:hypothetical protein [Streptomyces sp. NPDC050564]|uniref:hypothetical protein n=1 Tax=Streptomyces sp. NPDC050564 TaxID=3365631 RepID=UPI003798087F
MNHDLQTGLAWFGGINALAYVGFGAWISVVSVLEGRRLEAKRAELRARPAPLSQINITSADFDAELITLIEGDQK